MQRTPNTSPIHSLSRTIPNRSSEPSGSCRGFWAGIGIIPLIVAAMAISGCSSKSVPLTSPTQNGSPVIVGTKSNSLPPPPAQNHSNRYVAMDVLGSYDLNLSIFDSNTTYNYQQLVGVGSQTPVTSGGVFAPVGGFQQFDDTIQNPYIFSGYGAGIESSNVLFEFGFGGFPLTDLEVGVPVAQAGCLAPNGKVNFNFLQVPAVTNYNPAKDTLYGSASLTYKDGTFGFAGVQQSASGGGASSTHSIPFAASYCVQALGGYAIQSGLTPGHGGTEDLLLYLGPTGTIVGKVDLPATNNGTAFERTNFLGFVQPSGPVDLSSVTKASYEGFYGQPGGSSPPNPAYFGKASRWITTPVFSQSAASLVGANESVYNLLFGPVAAIPGDIVIDFGSQDHANPGLFPKASIKEQDPSNLCIPAQQSIGPDGNTYCTFPVAALISQSYAKYTIFVAGPEPTTGLPLFYALVQQ